MIFKAHLQSFLSSKIMFCFDVRSFLAIAVALIESLDLDGSS